MLPGHATGRMRCTSTGTVNFVAEEFNIVAMAEELARLMADDLEVKVKTVDVLDWLASTGLTLRQDEGDAGVAYGLALDDPL